MSLRETVEVKQTCLRPQGQPVSGLDLNSEARALGPRSPGGHHTGVFLPEEVTWRTKRTDLSADNRKINSSNGIREHVRDENINQHMSEAREHAEKGRNHHDW